MPEIALTIACIACAMVSVGSLIGMQHVLNKALVDFEKAAKVLEGSGE